MAAGPDADGGVADSRFWAASDDEHGRSVGGLTGTVLAANVVCVAGSMMMVFTPLLIDALRHVHGAHFGRQIALLGSADQTGMFAGAILALIAVPKLDRRMLAILGSGLLCLGDLLSITAIDLGGTQYAGRLLAGVGGGVAMGVAYAVFGASREPERSFALFGILQTSIGSVGILCLEPFVPRFGATTLYCASLLLALSGVGAGILMDARPHPGVSRGEPALLRDKALWTLGAMTGVTYFLFGLAAMALWANTESIGRSFGLSHHSASIAISASLLGSVAGSLLVMLTGNRWGRALPTAFISLAYLGGIALLTVRQGFMGFVVAVTAFQFGTNLGSPAFGAISEADLTGRLSIVYLLSLKAGFAIGPLAGSLFIDRYGYRSVIAAELGLSLAVCTLVGITLRAAHNRRAAQTSSQS